MTKYILIVLVSHWPMNAKDYGAPQALSMIEVADEAACKRLGAAAAKRWKTNSRAVEYLCEPADRAGFAR